MNLNGVSIPQLVKHIQSYYDGREMQEICAELDISSEELNRHIRELGELANEILELKDENDKLRQMFINLSLVNQSLRNALDAMTQKDSSLPEFISKNKKT